MRLLCKYQGFFEHHIHPDPQVEHVGSASLDGAEDGQNIGVLCMRVPSVSAGIKILWGKTARHSKSRAENLGIFAWRGTQAFKKNRCVGAPAQCAQDVGHKRCACEYRVRRSAEGCNSLLRFAQRAGAVVSSL